MQSLGLGLSAIWLGNGALLIPVVVSLIELEDASGQIELENAGGAIQLET